MSEQLIRQNKELVDRVLTPYFQRSLSNIKDTWQPHDKLPSTFSLACLLAQRHFNHSLQEGTQIIFSEIPQLPHFQEFASDWNRFISRIELMFEQLESGDWLEDGSHSWEAMQYALDITPRLMQEFYSLGQQCYQQFEAERALAIMGLVSLLNPLFFEPWLVQGIIYVQTRSSTEMALFCLTMAAIVRFDHPAPHLLMARCYHQLDDKELALRCAQIGADYMSNTQEPQWQNFLQQLQQDLRRC